VGAHHASQPRPGSRTTVRTESVIPL
jgi:hypothetical protein